jgi:hypothetical protein
VLRKERFDQEISTIMKKHSDTKEFKDLGEATEEINTKLDVMLDIEPVVEEFATADKFFEFKLPEDPNKKKEESKGESKDETPFYLKFVWANKDLFYANKELFKAN